MKLSKAIKPDLYEYSGLQHCILQLEQALIHHQEWYDHIMRSIICHLPIDSADLDPEIYRHCQLGQWFFGENSIKFHENKRFIALGRDHEKMHKIASKLLNNIKNNCKVSVSEYDRFAKLILEMRCKISELHRILSDLFYDHDVLTGVFNRVKMLSMLKDQQKFTKRQIYPCSLAMMDLDDFKKVNDCYGHESGDIVLKEVSKYIVEHIRPYDKIFRVGGEEFLISFQNADIDLAVKMVKRLLIGIAAMKFHVTHKQTIHITASFGVAAMLPNIPIGESIQHADKALYQAKKDGKNIFHIWTLS